MHYIGASKIKEGDTVLHHTKDMYGEVSFERAHEGDVVVYWRDGTVTCEFCETFYCRELTPFEKEVFHACR